MVEKVGLPLRCWSKQMTNAEVRTHPKSRTVLGNWLHHAGYFSLRYIIDVIFVSWTTVMATTTSESCWYQYIIKIVHNGSEAKTVGTNKHDSVDIVHILNIQLAISLGCLQPAMVAIPENQKTTVNPQSQFAKGRQVYKILFNRKIELIFHATSCWETELTRNRLRTIACRPWRKRTWDISRSDLVIRWSGLFKQLAKVQKKRKFSVMWNISFSLHASKSWDLQWNRS